MRRYCRGLTIKWAFMYWIAILPWWRALKSILRFSYLKWEKEKTIIRILFNFKRVLSRVNNRNRAFRGTFKSTIVSIFATCSQSDQLCVHHRIGSGKCWTTLKRANISQSLLHRSATGDRSLIIAKKSVEKSPLEYHSGPCQYLGMRCRLFGVRPSLSPDR